MAPAAIIYVPCIGTGDTITFVGHRLSKALSIAKDKRYRCSVSAQPIRYGPESSENNLPKFETYKSTISTDDGDVYDMFWLDYHENLQSSWVEMTTFVQIVKLFFAELWYLPRVLAILFYSSCFKCCRDKDVHHFGLLQSLLVLLIFFIFVGYLIVLVGTWVFKLPRQYTGLQENRFLEQLFEWIYLVITTMGMFFFDTTKRNVINVANTYTSGIFYLCCDGRKRSLRYEFESLLKEQCDEYDDIHIMAYSFGTIVSIDSLFPVNGPLIDASGFEKIRTFITIGSPFDLFRAIKSKYCSSERKNPYLELKKWSNFFVRDDLFGSNFRNDLDSGDSPLPGVSVTGNSGLSHDEAESLQEKLVNFGLPNVNHAVKYGEDIYDSLDLAHKLVYRLAAHGWYWNFDREDETDVFHMIAETRALEFTSEDPKIENLRPLESSNLNGQISSYGTL